MMYGDGKLNACVITDWPVGHLTPSESFGIA